MRCPPIRVNMDVPSGFRLFKGTVSEFDWPAMSCDVEEGNFNAFCAASCKRNSSFSPATAPRNRTVKLSLCYDMHMG